MNGQPSPLLDHEDGILLFSGKPRLGDVAHQGDERGLNLSRFDLLNGGDAQDITRDAPFSDLKRRLSVRTRHRILIVAIPCRSFSPARRKRVRLKDKPWGPAPGLDDRQLRFLARENTIITRAIQLTDLALSNGWGVIFEHPAKTNDKSYPYYNRRAKRCASIFDLLEVRRLAEEHDLHYVEFPQSALLGLTFKPTRLMYSSRLQGILARLGSLTHDRGVGGHSRGKAYGRDARGRSNSALTAAYPFAMCTVLVDCAELIVQPSHPRRTTAAAPTPVPFYETDDSDIPGLATQSGSSDADSAPLRPLARRRTRSDTDVSGGGQTAGSDTSLGERSDQEAGAAPSGLASTGPHLGDAVRAAIQRARHTPPPFASPRNSAPASQEELHDRPMRDDSSYSASLRSRHPPLPPTVTGPALRTPATRPHPPTTSTDSHCFPLPPWGLGEDHGVVSGGRCSYGGAADWGIPPTRDPRRHAGGVAALGTRHSLGHLRPRSVRTRRPEHAG